MWRTPTVPRNMDLPSVRPTDLAGGPPGRKMSFVTAFSLSQQPFMSKEAAFWSHLARQQIRCGPVLVIDPHQAFRGCRYESFTGFLVGPILAGEWTLGPVLLGGVVLLGVNASTATALLWYSGDTGAPWLSARSIVQRARKFPDR